MPSEIRKDFTRPIQQGFIPFLHADTEKVGKNSVGQGRQMMKIPIAKMFVDGLIRSQFRHAVRAAMFRR